MRVLVTQEIDAAGLEILENAGLTIVLRTGETPIDPAELLEQIAGCQGLLPMPTDRIDSSVMDAGPLRVISNHAVGLDNIDLAAAAARGIAVGHTPGVLTAATADLTLALILATARRVIEGDRLLRSGGFQGWRPTLLRGLDLEEARLGIVGLGRIGSAVADRARAFGMEVVHHSRSGGLSLDLLLETSDIVSLHCPLTPETHHLIDEAALRKMKSSAILVNTARGPIVDEACLARALSEHWIAGAGLDVFTEEPRVHPDLIPLPNTVLLPHLGSATRKTRRRMAELAAHNLVAGLAGEAMPHPAPRQ